MKYLKNFSFFESYDSDGLMRDLRNIGMERVRWGISFVEGYKMDEEAELDYTESWRSKSGSWVTEVTGSVNYRYGEPGANVDVRLKIVLNDNREYSAQLSTGDISFMNYVNIRSISPEGKIGPLEEKKYSGTKGKRISDGDDLIMKEILPLIDSYPQ